MSREILQEINEKEMINLNILPAITWRWLKVNEFPLRDLSLDAIQPYKNDFVKISPDQGIKIEPITENIRYFEIEKYFKSKENLGVSPEMIKLAESLYNTGAIIHVEQNHQLDSPLWLSFQSDGKNPTIIDNHLIIAEENSKSTIIIDYSSGDSSTAFHNGLTRIYAKEGAIVNLIKIQSLNDQSLHLDSNIAFVGYGAEVNYVSIELGAAKSATSYITNLEMDTGTSHLDSIYLTDGTRILDMNYIMNHIGRRTTSNIHVHGALKNQAKKTFKGTLDFKKGAALSKGDEEEYTILLDPQVKSDAIPLLLCQEDDVQGQHAASAGRIDEEKLFYLMTRGLSKKEARKVIVESAFRPIIDKVPVQELREKIERDIEKRLIRD